MNKIFGLTVVVLIACWSLGLVALVPLAQAATLEPGDLIKASSSAVYYYGLDAKRYVFPDQKTYETWYADFSSVKTITDEELAAIPIGGNVTYRPGVKMLKINTDPKVYAVSQDGTLHWVTTEAIAECLYGVAWEDLVADVSDAFFINYTIGEPITDCADYDKEEVIDSAQTIDMDKSLVLEPQEAEEPAEPADATEEPAEPADTTQETTTQPTAQPPVSFGSAPVPGTIGLSADIADSQYATRLVQMGSIDQKALRVLAQASNSAFKITEATISVSGSGGVANVGSVSISYPTDTSQTVYETKTGVVAGGIVQFTLMNWYVPKGIDSYMSVTVNVQTSVMGALSGSNPFILTLESQNGDLSSGLTKALSLSTSTFATANAAGDIDSAGNPLYARKTILTFNLNVSSPQGIDVAPGLNDYLIFDVLNSDGNSATINHLTFLLTATDFASSGWTAGVPATLQLYDTSDLATDLAASATITSTILTATTTEVVVELDNPGPTAMNINTSTTKSYKVKLDTTGASAVLDDVIRLDLISTDSGDGTVSCANNTLTCLEWLDGSGLASNGYKVENLPVTGLANSF